MSPVRVYLAAPYAAREQVRLIAAGLRRGGYEITSRWLDETHEITDGTTGAAAELTDQQVSQHAYDDLLDIDIADVLVAFTGASLSVANAGSGGRHVETGYALAKGLPIIVVGPPENVFHRLGRPHGVEVIASANGVMRALDRMGRPS